MLLTPQGPSMWIWYNPVNEREKNKTNNFSIIIKSIVISHINYFVAFENVVAAAWALASYSKFHSFLFCRRKSSTNHRGLMCTWKFLEFFPCPRAIQQTKNDNLCLKLRKPCEDMKEQSDMVDIKGTRLSAGCHWRFSRLQATQFLQRLNLGNIGPKACTVEIQSDSNPYFQVNKTRTQGCCWVDKENPMQKIWKKYYW